MSVVECGSILLRLGLPFTLYRIAFVPPRIILDRSRIGLLFTHKTGDLGAIFVTLCETVLRQSLKLIPAKRLCPITAQFRSVVRKSLSTVSAFSQLFPLSTVV